MLLKVTLTGRGAPTGTDLLIDVDPTATVGGLAQAIAERNPETLAGGSSPVAARSAGPPPGVRGSLATAEPAPDVERHELSIRIEGPGAPRVLDPKTTVGDATLRSGDAVSVVAESSRFLDAADVRSAAATLVVREGPDEGQRFALRAGANQAGRDRTSELVLTDPMVSKRHARFNVSDVVEVIDLGSVNGTFVAGGQVDRAVLRPGDTVLLGDTLLAVESVRAGEGERGAGAQEPFNRSPYLDPVYEGAHLIAPDPPSRPQRQRFPYIAMLAPIAMAGVMWAITGSWKSLIFIALSPIMIVGGHFEQKRAARKDLADARRAYAQALDLLDSKLATAQAEEVARRRLEHPATAQVLSSALGRGPMLWARRPDRHSFADVRLGLAAQPTRTVVDLPSANNSLPELWEQLLALVDRYRMVPDVPVVAPLREVGVLGVAGSKEHALGAARSVVAQIAGLHSPAELVIGGLFSAEAATQWDWIKWLPHTTSDHSPVDAGLLAAGPAAAPLAAAVLALVEDRLGLGETGHRSSTDEPVREPAVVMVIDDAAPVERPVLVALAERGPAAGVHLVWVAPTVDALPAAAKAFIAHDPATHAAFAGFIDGGLSVHPVTAEPLTADAALAFARSLAPVVDAGARTDEAGDLPARVSFLDQMGLELADAPGAVIERWRAGDSLPAAVGERRPRSKPAPLNAFVGMGAHGPLQLDLRGHGPHALVGGTTGAGKSEFLQSWILGMAANHSPARLTFLFVDYKGGAAFSECVKLPHCVGLVTDLTPQLVQRALASLNAELRHREHILNRKKVKDVLELERLHDPECPPSLVIVVDEFAALVAEVPEFVDGVVNVAQRGRSLGLHLILATQRPAGVIKDNLRANTNLRVALRMADEADSDDVVGSKLAAGFDPAVPGRGVAKLGPGRLDQFQAAYVGGWTTGEPPPPRIEVSSYAAAGSVVWPEAETGIESSTDLGPNDLARLVACVTAANDEVGLAPPRRPWLAELAPTYDIGKPPEAGEDLRLLSRTDERLVFGVLDDPDHQAQVPVAFEPDRDGNMAVIGTGGAGKSAFLRTLAVAAALSTKGGPCHVYGLDFASRGLDMLAGLPNVGAIIHGDDEDRVTRLLRTLRAIVDERLTRYVAAKADSITTYRRVADRPDEARILVLLDGFPAFRSDYESGSGRLRFYEMFQSIATDGRQAGVHVVLSADRSGAVPSAISSLVQRWLVLRLAGENEYAMAGVPAAAFPPGAPAGRGWCDGHEVQVGVLGASADPERPAPSNAEQAAAIARLGELAASRGTVPAPEIGSLPEAVSLGSLPAALAGRAVIGVGDLDLGPFAVPSDSTIVVAGPPKSGKTTALRTMLLALRRAHGAIPLVYVGDGRSDLYARSVWDAEVIGGPDARDAIDKLAATWEGRRSSPGASRDVAPAVVLVIDDLPKVAGWADADAIGGLVSHVVAAGGVVVGDGETSSMNASYGLVQTLKVSRTGLLLQPDQYDGENILKTPLPKFNRTLLPPGRGFFVNAGQAHKLQVALPEDGSP